MVSGQVPPSLGIGHCFRQHGKIRTERPMAGMGMKVAQPEDEKLPKRPKKAEEAIAQAKRAKLLLLSSAKGGSTKTTTARNLAVAAAHVGLRVATIDLDLQATLTNWWQKRPDDAPKIDHYQMPIEEAEAALADAMKGSSLDLFIVDTPPGVENHPSAMRALIRLADFVLMPTTQGGPDLDSVIEWWSQTVKREGRPSAFLLSRTKRSAKSYQEARQRLIKHGPLCPFDCRDLEEVQRTHYNGLGILEVRGAAGQDDIQGVWAYVAREIGLEG
jgi:chromosome partitioning protein